MMRLSLPALAASLAVLLSACGHAPGYPGNPPQRPDDVSTFAALYSENCEACHGQNGQNGPAIDLGNPEFQAHIDNTSLRKWIASGMPGTQMPAFAQSAGGTLTDQQVDALVAGMRKAWSSPNAFGGATPPAYAPSQLGDPHRGQQTYNARCAMCHEPSHQQITSSAYLQLVSDQVLRDIIIAGRPDIGQPDWRHDSLGGKLASPLSAEDVDDIVAYLGTLRNPAPAVAGLAPSAPSGR